MPTKIKIALLLQLLLIAQPIHAAITLDGTLGRSGAIAGPKYAITSDLGKQAGTNLFHSFSTFNLVIGDVATFSGPTNVSNIISRVTGGSASSIDGTLKSTISGANMYFLNPAGIMFGPNSSLDISGSFHVSTADYLKLGSDGRFDVATPANSVLTTAPPSAFGFVAAKPAGITVAGSILQVPDSMTQSLIAGDISVSSGVINGSTYGALVKAPGGGRLNLVSVASPGEVVPESAGITMNNFSALGNINVLGGSGISVSDQGAGTIFIRGGNLVVKDASYLGANTRGSTDGGGIDINLSQNMTISNDAYITSSSLSSGEGRKVSIEALNLSILDGGGIDLSTWGSGKGGDLNISVRDMFLLSGRSSNRSSYIASDTYESGNSGYLMVDAGSITIKEGGIHSSAGTGSSGHAGSVDIRAKGNLSLVNGGYIASDTYSSGNAGSVKISAGSIDIDRQGNRYITGVYSDANSGSTGNAGSVEILATGCLSIINDGRISSNTYPSGDAGSVKVGAGSITIDGQGKRTGIISSAYADSSGKAGSIDIQAAGNLSIINGGYIASDTYASGNAGSVKVSAGSISIDQNGSTYVTGVYSDANSGSTGHAGSVEVSTIENLSIINGGRISSNTSALGDAGSVKVDAGSITINEASINSFATTGSTGNAGSVDIHAKGKLSIINGGNIASSTYALGNAGSVKVSAGSIAIDRQGNTYITGIYSDANVGSTGHAGSVEVSTIDNLSIINDGRISSNTSSSGDAGSVKVDAGSITINGAGINSDADTGSRGNAGSVDIHATGKLSIINGGYIASDTYASGNAGSVKVSADSIVIDRQGNTYITGIYSDAKVGSTGHAGSVEVSTIDNLSIVNDGRISSNTSSSGDAGSVKVDAGSITINLSLIHI